MDLLARREHSARELQRKLEARGFTASDVASVLAALKSDNLLNERRFAEDFVRSRIGRGIGPLRIHQDLRGHGVSDADVHAALDELAPDWAELAAEARRRRFGDIVPAQFGERARQMRFLQRRGFEHDHIEVALSASTPG